MDLSFNPGLVPTGASRSNGPPEGVRKRLLLVIFSSIVLSVQGAAFGRSVLDRERCRPKDFTASMNSKNQWPDETAIDSTRGGVTSTKPGRKGARQLGRKEDPWKGKSRGPPYATTAGDRSSVLVSSGLQCNPSVHSSASRGAAWRPSASLGRVLVHLEDAPALGHAGAMGCQCRIRHESRVTFREHIEITRHRPALRSSSYPANLRSLLVAHLHSLEIARPRSD